MAVGTHCLLHVTESMGRAGVFLRWMLKEFIWVHSYLLTPPATSGKL